MSRLGERNKTKVARYPGIDFGYRYLIDVYGDIYDVFLEEYVSYTNSASHGYWMCYLCDVNGVTHPVEVHRIVASTWLGDIIGMEVHHKNENRLDPRVMNLEIRTPRDHAERHSRGEKNPTAILREKDVHTICKMLVAGETCRHIARVMSRNLRTQITTEMIEKISCKKTWTHISDQYGITVDGRETMNEFRNMRIHLAKMVINDGLSTREVAEHIGVEYKKDGKKTKRYMRLEKCLPRYVERYQTTTDMLEPIPGGPFEQFIRSKSGKKRSKSDN